MPSATGIAQAGESVRRPSICTAQTKHDATGSNPATSQSVGIAIPSARAAASTVVPAPTSTARPSIVSATVFIDGPRHSDPCDPCDPWAERFRLLWLSLDP